MSEEAAQLLNQHWKVYFALHASLEAGREIVIFGSDSEQVKAIREFLLACKEVGCLFIFSLLLRSIRSVPLLYKIQNDGQERD